MKSSSIACVIRSIHHARPSAASCGAAIAAVSIILASQPTTDWKTYFGATKDQQQKLETANKSKSTAVRTLRDDIDATTEQLRQKVEANAPDGDLLSTFGAARSDMKSLQKTENDFWDTVAGFLSPTQVAKLFLKSHPSKNPTPSASTTPAAVAPVNESRPAPAAGKPATVPAAPSQDWKTYFAASKEQQQKLDAANKARNEGLKPLRQQRDDQTEQVRQKIDAVASDNDVQAAFLAERSTEKAIQDAENGYWDAVAGFLTPMQQAKLFLRGRQKK